MFSQIFQKIREIINKMIGKTKVAEVVGITPVISQRMSDSIDLWGDMYENKAPWLHFEDNFTDVKVVSLGLPSLISSEKARMAVLEMKTEITPPINESVERNDNYNINKSDEEASDKYCIDQVQRFSTKVDYLTNPYRALYMNKRYEKLLQNIRTHLEYGIAKGGLVIKPYIVEKKIKDKYSNGEIKEYDYEIEFDFVQADAFYPISFDGAGNMTAVAFIQRKTDKGRMYSRLEYHQLLHGNKCKIINKAFVKNNVDNFNTRQDELGQEIPLSAVEEWAELSPEILLEDVNKLLFGYFRMPEANTIDTHSPLGVSGYSRAVGLIKEADLQFSRLLWEFEGGELAIDVDSLALQHEYDGKGGYTTDSARLQQRLFRRMDLNNDNMYEVFSPALRDVSLINGLNTILMRIEDACSLSRGTLSDVNTTEARTATELKILKQRSFGANADIQKALQKTLEDVIDVMNIYCDLYNIVDSGEYDVSFEWDDSILVDVEAEMAQRLTLVNQGLMSKLEYRQWFFGETERQSKNALQEIAQEKFEDMKTNLINQADIGEYMQDEKGQEDDEEQMDEEEESNEDETEKEDEEEKVNNKGEDTNKGYNKAQKGLKNA